MAPYRFEASYDIGDSAVSQLKFAPLVGQDISGSRRVVLRGLGGAGLATALLWGSRRRGAAHGAEDVAREALEALIQAIATGDDSGLDALFAADVTVVPRHRTLATGEEVAPGLPGLKAALADIRSIASDVELTVDDLIAEEDKAAGPFTFRGTLGPTAQPLEGSGLVYMVVADDLVSELWIYPDPETMMAVFALAGMATPAP